MVNLLRHFVTSGCWLVIDVLDVLVEGTLHLLLGAGALLVGGCADSAGVVAALGTLRHLLVRCATLPVALVALVQPWVVTAFVPGILVAQIQI